MICSLCKGTFTEYVEIINHGTDILEAGIYCEPCYEEFVLAIFDRQ